MHQPVYLYACTCVFVIGLCICMLWHSSFATPLVLFAFYDSTYIIQYLSANIHTTLLLLLWLLRKTCSSTSTSTLSPPRFLTVCQLILRTFHTTGTPSPATGATQTLTKIESLANVVECFRKANYRQGKSPGFHANHNTDHFYHKPTSPLCLIANSLDFSHHRHALTCHRSHSNVDKD